MTEPPSDGMVFPAETTAESTTGRDTTVQRPPGRVLIAPSSFADFYLAWMPRLTAYLRAQTSDGRWAEDIAQEAFIAARENWDELMLSEKPGSWLFHVANRMQRRWLTKTREQCTSLDEMVGGSPAAEPGKPVSEGVRDQYLDLVAAIRTLPRRQREVITLHCVIEFPLTEAADILGITASSAKTHLTRARERLTELLDRPAAATPAVATPAVATPDAATPDAVTASAVTPDAATADAAASGVAPSDAKGLA